MKYMLVFYDCDICGKVHLVRAEWSLECEIDVRYWPVDMANVAAASLLSGAKHTFYRFHPNGVFDSDRLVLSQLFEEDE